MKNFNFSFLKSYLFLMLAAAIWGITYCAQRLGVQYIGPFTFNAVRFSLGAISLIPFVFFIKSENNFESEKNTAKYGFITGILLFSAASLQQIGIQGTTAGKAAFITGFYIILVPIFESFFGKKISRKVWIGALSAIVGLYYLCVSEKFTVEKSDMLILISSFIWSLHILAIGKFSENSNLIKLSIIQYEICAIMSTIVAVIYETITIEGLYKTTMPIFYGGIFAVGLAYTFQVFGQKNIKPSHASFILSLETVFGAVSAYLILGEVLSFKSIIGCIMMLIGIIYAQLDESANKSS